MRKTGHGDGRVNNVTEMGEAWRLAAAAFRGTQVKFEVFNEPFGYKIATEYVDVMHRIIAAAGLPKDRVVLDGLGYADDVQAISGMWPGWLGFHIYPNWEPDGSRTQENFSNLVQHRLDGVSHRTLITEFGAALNKQVDYEKYDPSGHDGDVNMYTQQLRLNAKTRATIYVHTCNIAQVARAERCCRCTKAQGGQLSGGLLLARMGQPRQLLILGRGVPRETQGCEDPS